MNGSPADDVRMRGFLSRQTVEDALVWVDARTAQPLPAEQVSLHEAAGRTLAEDVVATVDVPTYLRAMMDGFAVVAADTQGASPYNRLILREIGVSLPGNPSSAQITSGCAVRIMTGAPLPEGADAVLPVEITEAEEQAPRDDDEAARIGRNIYAVGAVPAGKHVGQRGEDVASGSTILRRGRRLRPQDLGVLSSIGMSQVTVVRQPRVRVAITGNEVLPAGSRPGPSSIVDANGPMLAALVRRDGGVPHFDAKPIPDEIEEIRRVLTEDCDVLLVSGGSSVGEEDWAPMLVAELGELSIHGVAMRPSSPTGLGVVGEHSVVLLPGNPVSCLCAYDFFAGRMIRRLAGRSSDWPYRRTRAPLVRKLVSMIGRVDYARVQVDETGVTPLSTSGASLLSSTTRADGFVVIHADSEGFPAGSEVDVFLYDDAGGSVV